jgi:hypothetical protein
MDYLVNSFNSTVHLFPETSANDVFYITSDNLLASYAIRNYNQTLSETVISIIKDYAKNYSLPVDAQDLPISFKHEVIIGDILVSHINDSITHIIPNSMGYRILSDRADSVNITYPYINADQDALEGLSLCNQKQDSQTREQAVLSYNHMMKFWDGNGFADAAFNSTPNHVYLTYKLGLAIMLSNKLEIFNSSLNEKMVNLIGACQLEKGGGVRTDYTINGTSVVPSGLANAETTSIIAIANPTIKTSSISPSPTPTVPELFWFIVLPLFASAIFAILLLRIKRNVRYVGNSHCNYV